MLYNKDVSKRSINPKKRTRARLLNQNQNHNLMMSLILIVKKDDNIFEFVVKDDNGSILCIKCKCCDNKLRIEINGKEVDVTQFFKTILSHLLFNILYHVINIST